MQPCQCQRLTSHSLRPEQWIDVGVIDDRQESVKPICRAFVLNQWHPYYIHVRMESRSVSSSTAALCRPDRHIWQMHARSVTSRGLRSRACGRATKHQQDAVPSTMPHSFSCIQSGQQDGSDAGSIMTLRRRTVREPAEPRQPCWRAPPRLPSSRAS